MPAKPIFNHSNAAEYGRKGALALAAKRKAIADLAAKDPPDNISVLTEHLKRVDEMLSSTVQVRAIETLARARACLQDQLLQLQNPVQSQPKRNGKVQVEARPEAKPIGYTTSNSVQSNLD